MSRPKLAGLATRRQRRRATRCVCIGGSRACGPGWVCPGVDFLELADGDLGVNLRRVDVGVTKQLLDKTDVGSALEHERRAGVAEEMARAALADLGAVDVAAHQLA